MYIFEVEPVEGLGEGEYSDNPSYVYLYLPFSEFVVFVMDLRNYTRPSAGYSSDWSAEKKEIARRLLDCANAVMEEIATDGLPRSPRTVRMPVTRAGSRVLREAINVAAVGNPTFHRLLDPRDNPIWRKLDEAELAFLVAEAESTAE